jgi:zinc/manganese transport system substrate-binding protein
MDTNMKTPFQGFSLQRKVLSASPRNSAFFAPLRFALGLLFMASAAHAKLAVVATTPDLAAIAQEIGGKLLDITTLARPAEDPHFVDAKPSFIVKLNKADVLLHGGAELELAWLSPLLSGARNAQIVSAAKGEVRCCEGVRMLEVPATLDRSQGDIHAGGNPHFMVDPINAKIAVHHIADVLAKLDAAQAATYQANFTRFAETLDAKLAEWQKKLEPFKGARIAAYHNSWPYFAQRFGLKIDLFLEPKPGIPPSPAHLAEVIARMKDQKVKVIFHDPYLDRRTAETVAAATGARVVPVTQYPGGVKGSEGGYLQMMDYLVNAVASALARTE